MKRKYVSLVIVFLIIISLVVFYYELKLGTFNNNAKTRTDKQFQVYEYNKDVIGDKETAINVAESILLPIYGKKLLNQCYLDGWLEQDSIWHIGIKRNIIGFYGGPLIKIQKKDGKVLAITNEK